MSNRNNVHTVAIIQQSSAVLDVESGIERAEHWIAEAADNGAELVVFPESWLGGYPAWMFEMAGWDDAEAKHWYGKFLEQSLVVGEGLFTRLQQSAREHSVTVTMGLNERDSAVSGSVFNAQVIIGPDGEILNHHRKLTPTHTERLAWSNGDGRGLTTVASTVGQLGGLICWEHWHPLIRYTLHAQDEQVHVAAWPDMSDMHVAASRTYAFEGRTFVLAAAQYLELDDVPEAIQEVYKVGAGTHLDQDRLVFNGGSGIVGPDGNWIAEPVFNQATIVYGSIDLRDVARQKHDLDIVGHYGRLDMFQLSVDTSRQRSITFT